MESLSEENLRNIRKILEKQEALRATADAFFDLSSDLLAITSADGHFVHVNGRWAEILGWTEAELLSKPFIQFVHPDDREKTMEAAQLATIEAVEYRNRYQTKDGSYITLIWRSRMDFGHGVMFASARVSPEDKV